MEKIKNNLETFFTIWGIILVLNQVFIFGGCFAPYCLLAALPHTGVIAFIVSIFYIKDNKRSSQVKNNMPKLHNSCKEKVAAEIKQKLDNYRNINSINRKSTQYSVRQTSKINRHIEMWLNTAETVLATLKKDSDCQDVKEATKCCFDEIDKLISYEDTDKSKIQERIILENKYDSTSKILDDSEQSDETVVMKEEDDILQEEIKPSIKIRIHEIAKKLNLSSKEVISHAQQLGYQVKTAMSTVSEKDANNLIQTIHQKDKTKKIQNDVTLYDDNELNKLKKELKSLELKLQTLLEQKTEYLNNIEEFNREYNLHLGELIRTILNLKKEILYKKTIKQEKQKEKYNEDKQTFEETKETIDELRNTIDELKEALESIDESHESYDEIKSAYEELQDELKKLENELEIQEEELAKTKEFIEDDEIQDEYEEAKSHYDEYENDYEQIKQNQKDLIELNDNEKSELKKLYKKAARLCHPDIVADTLKEKAHEMMQQLNETYSRQDLVQLKKILHSLESGTIFNLTSDSVNDTELLKEKIKEYKETLKHIEDEIAEIQEDDSYKTISNLEDWDAYFEELKNELKKEKERLEEEAEEVLQKSEETTQKTKSIQIKQQKKVKETIIQKEYKTPYAKHILSIENPNFEKIRRYCNNLVNENQAGKMQELLAQNGKMYKALIYDALEQFLVQLNGETITLIDWGCDQGIASMLVRDYIREKQLDIKVSQVILIDSNKAKLSRAMTQVEAVAYDKIEIIALKSDDNKLFDTIKIYKNDITLNLFANDEMPVDFLDIDYDIFKKDYFMCVSNESKEFVEEVYGNITSWTSCQDLSIRDAKIGRFTKYERIFKID
jgi:hypothetical protein